MSILVFKWISLTYPNHIQKVDADRILRYNRKERKNMNQTEVRKQLFGLQEEGYQKFSSSLIPGVRDMLGIRIPVLRKLAKKLAKEDWKACLDWKEPLYFEERQLQAFIIGYAKDDIEEIIAALRRFIPTVDNWSVNDSLCSSLKIARKYPEEIWNLLMEYRDSQSEFEVRVVAVTLMAQYLVPEYMDRVLSVLGSLPIRGYYTSMGVAWAFATSWAKFPEKTKKYLKEHPIDRETYRKTLQKCIESYRIREEDKEWMREERSRIAQS